MMEEMSTGNGQSYGCLSDIPCGYGGNCTTTTTTPPPELIGFPATEAGSSTVVLPLSQYNGENYHYSQPSCSLPNHHQVLPNMSYGYGLAPSSSSHHQSSPTIAMGWPGHGGETTLEALVNSQLDLRFMENNYEVCKNMGSAGRMMMYDPPLHDHHGSSKSLVLDQSITTTTTTTTNQRNYSILSFDGTSYHHKVEYNGLMVEEPSLLLEADRKPPPNGSKGVISFLGRDSSSSSSTRKNISSKTRIRWSQDLHDRFVECVNLLGGAEKATPKGVLKLMSSNGLTMLQVKSHLQKYRFAMYIKDSTEDKSEREDLLRLMPQLDSKTGMGIVEALRLQVDVQRHLYEQLESQRELQLRIEEQGKELKKLLDLNMEPSKTFTDESIDINPSNCVSASLKVFESIDPFPNAGA